MSIVSSIRDYVDFLNTLSDSLGNQFTSSKFITETCFYFLKTLQYSVSYIFTFQWLRDFSLLPVAIPQLIEPIFSESLSLQSPAKIFFEFLEIPSLEQNKFILGFFNSFFLTLPITVTHIITLRRLIIQGIPAAFFSFLGFIIGQTFFILCVTFGIRSILIPWLSLEPLNYFLGVFLIFQIVYNMVGENLIPLKWNSEGNKIFFRKFFITNLLLSWCEQACIFQYLSNLTITGHTSILETFSTKTTVANFFTHSNYIFGIFIGSIVFSIVWSFVILQIKNLIVNLPSISLSSFIQAVNKTSFIIVLGFTLSSIPFYGLDYLITGPLGFISQDNVFKNTLVGQNNLKDPISYSANMPSEPLDIDISTFDRGQYLVVPNESSVYSFEDLNYHSEYDWITRFEKFSNIGESKASFLSIGNIFKNQKNQLFEKKGLNFIDSNQYEKANSLLNEKEILNDEQNSIQDSRFQDWYNLSQSDLVNSNTNVNDDKLDVETEDSDLLQELAIQTNFKNFNIFSFPEQFFVTENKPLIEKKIKQKYLTNPVYKGLLALDIDLFLKRQPKSFFLSGDNEFDLYEKRHILNSYYDSLRLYNKLPYASSFEDFFDGTKSFTNKVYNQQFKGTLKVVSRFFSLSNLSTNLLTEKINKLPSVLKYDQPLYENREVFSPYHEEISEKKSFDFQKRKSSESGLDYPFLTDFISKPLYAGWDKNLRKFVITNKLLPRASAGYEMALSQEWSNTFNKEKQLVTKQDYIQNKINNSEKIKFTVWPKPREIFFENKNQLSFSVLFNTKMADLDYIDNDVLPVYTSLPQNLEIVLNKIKNNQSGQPGNVSENITENVISELAPKRGGFVWPGNINFNFKKLFQ